MATLCRQHGCRAQEARHLYPCPGSSNSVLDANELVWSSPLWSRIFSGSTAAHVAMCNLGSLLTCRTQTPVAALRPPRNDCCSIQSAPGPLGFPRQLTLASYADQPLRGERDTGVWWEDELPAGGCEEASLGPTLGATKHHPEGSCAHTCACG